MDYAYEAVVIGGAFSGAATGLLLKRQAPEMRVLIVERAAEFDRKVGESTTEVSSCFLTRVLGLTNYLGHHQLNKQGLRMWFARTPEEPFEDCVELGARYQSRLAGFQVDRATLDEHVLEQAVEAGCELWRPAKVAAVELGGVGRNALEVRVGEERRQVSAQWVVDASGRAAVLARKLGHFRALEEHPINSLWARFTGVKDWDGNELRTRFPEWAAATRTGRGWATNHLMGYGWWCWIIPLKGGDVSVGLTYDARLFQPPVGGTIGERLLAHFQVHPVGREILGQAVPVEGDQRAFSMLPYFSEKMAGDGWALVGDAAGFIDPLYSPGLDFCAFTSSAACRLIAQGRKGMEMAPEVESLNTRFAFCYRSWFEGIYLDKYYYLGDAELMAAAFLLDVASYHLGPVRQVYAKGQDQFALFPFDGIPGRVVAKILRFQNARLSALGRRKKEAGLYGANNAGWRMLVGGFAPEPGMVKLLLRGMRLWLAQEWKALWWRRPTAPASAKTMVGPLPETAG